MERTKNTENNVGYWSPKEFITYGFRSEGVIPLFFDNLSSSLSANISKIDDKDKKEKGNGYDVSARIIYGPREKNNFSIYAIKIKSRQNGSSWTSKQFGVSANIFW